MADVSHSIEIRIDGVTERRDDHYAAQIKSLGITAYADTPAAARERALKMVDTLTSHILEERGYSGLVARLKRSGIKWQEPTVGSWETDAMIGSAATDQMVADHA